MFLAPITDVEWWVSYDVVCFEIGEFIVCQSIAPANIGVYATYRHVHLGQAPSSLVVLLTIYSDIIDPPLVLLDELFTPDKHTATTAGWVVDAAAIGLEHLNQ